MAKKVFEIALDEVGYRVCKRPNHAVHKFIHIFNCLYSRQDGQDARYSTFGLNSQTPLSYNVPRLCDVGRSAAKANVPKAEERSDEAHSLCYVP